MNERTFLFSQQNVSHTLGFIRFQAFMFSFASAFERVAWFCWLEHEAIRPRTRRDFGQSPFPGPRGFRVQAAFCSCFTAHTLVPLELTS